MPLKPNIDVEQVSKTIAEYAGALDTAAKKLKEAETRIQSSRVSPHAAYSAALSKQKVDEEAEQMQAKAEIKLKSLDEWFAPGTEDREKQIFYNYWLAQYYADKDKNRALGYLLKAIDPENPSLENLNKLDDLFPLDEKAFNEILLECSGGKAEVNVAKVLKLIDTFARNGTLYDSMQLPKMIDFETLAQIFELRLDSNQKTLPQESEAIHKLMEKNLNESKISEDSAQIPHVVSILKSYCQVKLETSSRKARFDIAFDTIIGDKAATASVKEKMADQLAIAVFEILSGYNNAQERSEYRELAKHIYAISLHDPLNPAEDSRKPVYDSPRLLTIIKNCDITVKAKIQLPFIAEQFLKGKPKEEEKIEFIKACILKGISLSDLNLQNNTAIKDIVIDFFKDEKFIEALPLNNQQMSNVISDFTSEEINTILKSYGQKVQRLKNSVDDLSIYGSDLISTINEILQNTNEDNNKLLPSLELEQQIMAYMDDYDKLDGSKDALVGSQERLTKFLDKYQMGYLSKLIQIRIQEYFFMKQFDPRFELTLGDQKHFAEKFRQGLFEVMWSVKDNAVKKNATPPVASIDDLDSRFKIAAGQFYMAFTGSKSSPLFDYAKLKPAQIAYSNVSRKLLPAVLMNTDKYQNIETIQELTQIIIETNNGDLLQPVAQELFEDVKNRDKLLDLFELMLKIDKEDAFFDEIDAIKSDAIPNIGLAITNYIMSEYVKGNVGQQITLAQQEKLSAKAFLYYLADIKKPLHERPKMRDSSNEDQIIMKDIFGQTEIKLHLEQAGQYRDLILDRIINTDVTKLDTEGAGEYGRILLNILDNSVFVLSALDAEQLQILNKQLKELQEDNKWIDDRNNSVFGKVTIFLERLIPNPLKYNSEKLAINDQVALNMFFEIQELKDTQLKSACERSLTVRIINDINQGKASSYINLCKDPIYGPKFMDMIFRSINLKSDALIITDKVKALLFSGLANSDLLTPAQMQFLTLYMTTEKLVTTIKHFMEKSKDLSKEAESLEKSRDEKALQSQRIANEDKDKSLELSSTAHKKLEEANTATKRSLDCKETAKNLCIRMLQNDTHRVKIALQPELLVQAAKNWSFEDCIDALTKMNSKENGYHLFTAYLLSRKDVDFETLKVHLIKFDIANVSMDYIKKFEPTIIDKLFKDDVILTILKNASLEQMQALIDKLSDENILKLWPTDSQAFEQLPKSILLYILNNEKYVKELISSGKINDYLDHKNLDLYKMGAEDLESINKFARAELFKHPQKLFHWNDPDPSNEVKLLALISGFEEGSFFSKIIGKKPIEYAEIFNAWPANTDTLIDIEQFKCEQFALKLLFVHKPDSVMKFLEEKHYSYSSQMAIHLLSEIDTPDSMLAKVLNQNEKGKDKLILQLLQYAIFNPDASKVIEQLNQNDYLISYIAKYWQAIIKVADIDLKFLKAILQAPRIVAALNEEQLKSAINKACELDLKPSEYLVAIENENDFAKKQGAFDYQPKLIVMVPTFINSLSPNTKDEPEQVLAIEKIISSYCAQQDDPLQSAFKLIRNDNQNVKLGIAGYLFNDPLVFKQLCNIANNPNELKQDAIDIVQTKDAIDIMQIKIDKMNENEFKRQLYHPQFYNKAFRNLVTNGAIALNKELAGIVQPIANEMKWNQRNALVRGLAKLAWRVFGVPKSRGYEKEIELYTIEVQKPSKPVVSIADGGRTPEISDTVLEVAKTLQPGKPGEFIATQFVQKDTKPAVKLGNARPPTQNKFDKKPDAYQGAKKKSPPLNDALFDRSSKRRP